MTFKTRFYPFLRVLFSGVLALLILTLLLKNQSFLSLVAGICIFLFAMSLLAESFKSLSGGILDKILTKVANKNYKAFFFGFTLSTLVQSSGLTSVLAISFLSAGLMSLSCGVAMIYGINLSTAFSAWLVGYFGLKSSLSLYAMPLIVFGVMMYLSKDKKIKACGLFLLSIGFLFLGISYMKEGFESFKQSLDISKYQMQGFLGLIVYVFVGIIITSLTQSSHATLTLAITALSVGQISYENSLAIAIGANIGSTLMSILASLKANTQGQKIALTHLFFNVFAAVLSIVFFKAYMLATDFLALKIGIEDNAVLKLASFTTLFNVIAVILLYPFIPQVCKALNRFIKAKEPDFEKPLYLNESALEFSDSAKEVLFLESAHLYGNTQGIIAQMMSFYPSDIYSKDDVILLTKTRNQPLELDFDALYLKKFKGVYSEIIDFVVRASSNNASNLESFTQIRRINLLMATALKLSKELQVNILKYAFSSNEYVREEYAHLRRNVLRMLRLSNDLINTKDEKRANDLKSALEFNIKKYDALSSNSLDALIRYKRITDTLATSIMNDTAMSRAMAKEMIEAASLISAYRIKKQDVN